MTQQRDYKQAAIEQWSGDPCGSSVAEGEPGSKAYFEDLLRARADYAAWMADALDYAGARDLDVVDIGCGQGIDLARYAMAGGRAIGVDLTPRHVELANLHLAALDLQGRAVLGDAERLPFGAESFDRLSSNGVLHHTPDMPAALREARRVLRPGGEARIIVYNRNSLHYWTDQVLYHGIVTGKLFRERSMQGVMSRTVEFSSTGARPLVRVYSPRQFRNALRSAGFEQVTVRKRHFRPEDSVLTGWLRRRFPSPHDSLVLDRIGRVAGWYLVGHGRRSL
jgi:ubiquinone/menaquinone biosynthesis C-methylase UbiE